MNEKNIIELSESEWVDKYKPITVPDGIPSGGWTDEDGRDTLFETYDEAITEIRKHDNKYVWTLIEEDDKQFITEGVHWVNRMGYFVTEVPHNDESYLVEVEQ
ncbi:hypothetical protein H8D29_03675 [PVC group bacterium]|nr:hypothetical protein [PVC group bacterium]